MRHRLSPRVTVVVDFLGGRAAANGPPSDRADAVETAASCCFASCKPGCGGCAAFPAASPALDGNSACAWVVPEPAAGSASATATLCLDSVCLAVGFAGPQRERVVAGRKPGRGHDELARIGRRPLDRGSRHCPSIRRSRQAPPCRQSTASPVSSMRATSKAGTVSSTSARGAMRPVQPPRRSLRPARLRGRVRLDPELVAQALELLRRPLRPWLPAPVVSHLDNADRDRGTAGRSKREIRHSYPAYRNGSHDPRPSARSFSGRPRGQPCAHLFRPSSPAERFPVGQPCCPMHSGEMWAF